MSQIEELIAKLCPEGVEYKAIGDFGELVRGNGMPKADFVESGVGCIHYGQIYTYYGIWTTETMSFVSAEKAKNLTYFNPNVYHEVGFMDGKAKAFNIAQADVLLFLDESVPTKNQKVGFNLSGSKQIRFKRIAEFTKQLRENLERHFKLKH